MVNLLTTATVKASCSDREACDLRSWMLLVSASNLLPQRTNRELNLLSGVHTSRKYDWRTLNYIRHALPPLFVSLRAFCVFSRLFNVMCAFEYNISARARSNSLPVNG